MTNDKCKMIYEKWLLPHKRSGQSLLRLLFSVVDVGPGEPFFVSRARRLPLSRQIIHLRGPEARNRRQVRVAPLDLTDGGKFRGGAPVFPAAGERFRVLIMDQVERRGRHGVFQQAVEDGV